MEGGGGGRQVQLARVLGWHTSASSEGGGGVRAGMGGLELDGRGKEEGDKSVESRMGVGGEWE